MVNSIGICTYCGLEKTLTREHIPPKNLFSSGDGVEYRFVLICAECNRGFSKDEEFFRNWLVNAHYEFSKEATQLFDGPITRAYTRKPALAQHFFDKMELVDIYNPTTVVTEKKTALYNSPADKKRIINVTNKIVRGLASWHFGTRVSDDMQIQTMQVNNDWLIKNQDSVERMPLITVKKNVFEYKYGQIPGSQFSMWLMRFYDGATFVGFIADKTIFK